MCSTGVWWLGGRRRRPTGGINKTHNKGVVSEGPRRYGSELWQRNDELTAVSS
ncbi:hypothetical protein PISMIDRAFT_687187 [Pisolithus microcarpus 441]|uniref:Uncharacterized protein n=2 Tax=Pisolithus microcarpus 441 TaxID=765257 RepID=A0A0C9YZK6_9AGAM|nr:hypothetical protein PISMIDRAFT_687187 [Pisolithus microcarpus 441]